MASRLTRHAPSVAALSALDSALASFRISQPSVGTIAKRHASHQAQGRANGAADGPGKRLGAKKTGGEYVVTGNIIYRQRGTLWFPGDNCFMGRDHTIHAGAPGYVTYYRDPARHPKRKFIGIVFEQNQTLPQSPHEIRRRRLGMLAYQVPKTQSQIAAADLTTDGSGTEVREEPNEFRGVKIIKGEKKDKQEIKLHLRPGGMYRQANWEIGRAAETSRRAQAVTPFKPGDRFAAWRKTRARKERAAERRAMGRGGKSRNKKK
ncbi:54S ribosomal L2, mitochondrial [Lecanosticta acicola]|uniref:Large ribosomal subunit protein bL27m n=1 Tax=Lecanosticta acicola TaxID=111012 RepID=A0AAI9EAK2_9PEZI|nr:54S ribosomal L2, mitochondrial [Lecanosticta acicola]